MPNGGDEGTEISGESDDPVIDVATDNEADHEEDENSEKGAAKKKKSGLRKTTWSDVLTFCRELEDKEFKLQCLICL